jgi:hypothetical protein
MSSYYESNNLIVRVKGNSSSRDAILLSSHFDSTPVSKGVTDAGIGIAVMLEMIRTLLLNKPLKHDVMFNFNNGEEMYLYGAIAFVRHPWFKHVKGFINLEGTGSAPGTRSILFRTNSYSLVKAWKNYAPYPHASILFNNLVQFIHSDTDYRPYVNLGEKEGVDIAFYTYRYWYHTPKDDLTQSYPISAQHMGDNVKGLTLAVADSDVLDHLETVPRSGNFSDRLPVPNFVYYDFFNSFTLLKGSRFKGMLGLLLFLVIAIGVLKSSMEGVRLGSQRLFKMYFKPMLEAYLLIFFSIGLALLNVFVLSSVKSYINMASTYGSPLLNISWIGFAVLASFAFAQWYWPRIARALHLRRPRSTFTTLQSQISNRSNDPASRAARRMASIQVNGPPVYKWLPYGLLAFWSTLLVGPFLLSLNDFHGLYLFSDWAFYSLLAVGLTQALAPIILKWWRADAALDSHLSKWKVVMVRFYEKHIWTAQLLISTTLPALLTLDIFSQISMIIPTSKFLEDTNWDCI